MNFRKLSAMAALLIVTLPALPIVSASGPCEDSIAAFQSAFAEANFQFSLSVATSLESAVYACDDLPPVDPGDLPDPSTLIPPPIQAAQRELARNCGFADVATASVPSAPITVTYQALVPLVPISQQETDSGPATGIYDPTTDLTTYSVRGVKWGFDAVSTQPGSPGHATIYLHGVPIPATFVVGTIGTGWGAASSGCTPDTLGEMCWASGDAKITLSVAIWINVHSDFSIC